jgi:hypothetical protein
MTFAKDFAKLKSAQKSALLMLENTLDGAAKAARQAVREEGKPETPEPEPQPPEPELVTDEPEPDPDPIDDWDFEEEPPTQASPSGGKRTPPKADKPDSEPVEVSPEEKARHTLGLWVQTLDAMLAKSPTIDELRKTYPSPHGDKAVRLIADARGALADWKRKVK